MVVNSINQQGQMKKIHCHYLSTSLCLMITIEWWILPRSRSSHPSTMEIVWSVLVNHLQMKWNLQVVSFFFYIFVYFNLILYHVQTRISLNYHHVCYNYRCCMHTHQSSHYLLCYASNVLKNTTYILVNPTLWIQIQEIKSNRHIKRKAYILWF